MNISKGTISYLNSDNLTKRIVKELGGREMYSSNETTFEEKIFDGSVFESILEEVEGFEDTAFAFDKESVSRLEKLAELIDTDYVLVTFLD